MRTVPFPLAPEMAAPTDPARVPMTRFEDHPLEIFAGTRGFRPSPLRILAAPGKFDLQLAGILAHFAMLFAKPAEWRGIAWANVMSASCIGQVIHANFAIGDYLTGRRCRD